MYNKGRRCSVADTKGAEEGSGNLEPKCRGGGGAGLKLHSLLAALDKKRRGLSY